MDTESPQFAVSRVFDAPRALVFRAFTDPDHLATGWGRSTSQRVPRRLHRGRTQGALDWAPPDDVFAATTALLRSVGTFLYGRRLYEAMSVWETNPGLAEQSELTADFANTWQAADKVVCGLPRRATQPAVGDSGPAWGAARSGTSSDETFAMAPDRTCGWPCTRSSQRSGPANGSRSHRCCDSS